jgi:tetratricopeptide (TPR) repeat protein
MSELTSEGQTPEVGNAALPMLPDSVEELLVLGQQYLDQGNFIDAQHTFEKVLALDPAQPTAQHNLGYALECQGADEAAVAAYETATRGTAGAPQSCFNLGVLLAGAGRDAEARQAFERALVGDPAFAKAWVNLGVLHARTGELAEARRCYEKALETDPACLSARLKLANLRARENQRQEALDDYSRLLEEGWNQAEVQYRRGLVLMASGEDEEALQAFELALEGDGEHVPARIQLALLYAQQEDYERAAERLQQAASLAPNDALVQYNLGNMHARKAIEGQEIANYGYADAATRAYRRAIELDPRSLKAYYNLACVVEKMSVHEGITAWEQYLEVARDVPAEQEWLVKARRYLRSLKDAASAS